MSSPDAHCAPRIAVAVALAIAFTGFAASAQTPGATVDELLALGRRLNPELAAAALESEAAEAKVQGADSLPDPTFSVFSDQNQNRNGGLRPSRLGNLTYTLQQTFPLGGKRDLKREVASAEARQAGSRRQAMETELAQRIKVVFAEYYRTSKAIELTRELHQVIHSLSRVAESRYAQNLGSQQDVLKANVERAAIEQELVRLERDRREAIVRLNRLVNRDVVAALSEPQRLRAMPAATALSARELADRARRTNPALASSSAQIDAADASRRLVDASWTPDLTAGFGVVQDGDRIMGYEAMVTVNVPLRWGLREAQAREATAMAGAARLKREAVERQLEAEIGEALIGLRSLQEVANLLKTSTIPQSRAAFQSGLRGFELGRWDILSVLDSYHRLRQAELELLRIESEQQARLAELERVIGEDL